MRGDMLVDFTKVKLTAGVDAGVKVMDVATVETVATEVTVEEEDVVVEVGVMVPGAMSATAFIQTMNGMPSRTRSANVPLVCVTK